MLYDTTIMIPTMGRLDKQLTLGNLSPELLEHVWLVVDSSEYLEHCHKYDLAVSVMELPADVKGIGNVRQWCIDNCETQYLFLLDDDMVFFQRIGNTVKLEHCKGNDLNSMFEELHDYMSFDGYPVVGLSARQGNNRMEGGYKDVTRQMNFHGIDIDQFVDLGLVFNGQEVMEDFCMTLNLLTQGIANRVMYSHCWNQVGSGAEGGCSSYRTYEVQKRCAHELAEKFPDFVTAVQKKTTSTWKDFPDRWDVRVQWKKAYEYGLKLHT